MSKRKLIIVGIGLFLIALASSAFYVTYTKQGNAKTCTTYGNKAKEQCVEDYVGLSQKDAIERAKKYDYTPKVVSIDGKGRGFTDLGGNPIYLEVNDGVVTGGYFEDGRKAR